MLEKKYNARVSKLLKVAELLHKTV